jgi:apoptotic chromatin condensation inducer in the nucleus
VATRNAVCNLQWPPNNGSCLIAEFVDPQEVKLKLEPLPRPPVPLSPSTATAPCQLSKANQTIPPHAAATSRGMLPTPAPLVKLHPASDPATAREMLPPPPDKLEPSRKLEDLFKKTKAYPRIYYMPLSQEEALAKFEARGSTRYFDSLFLSAAVCN